MASKIKLHAYTFWLQAAFATALDTKSIRADYARIVEIQYVSCEVLTVDCCREFLDFAWLVTLRYRLSLKG